MVSNKKTYKLILAISLLLTIFGCKRDSKEADAVSKGKSLIHALASVGGMSEGEINYSVYCNTDSVNHRLDSNITYNGSAQFFTDNTFDPSQCEDVGTVNIGGINFNTNRPYWGGNAYYFTLTNRVSGINNSQFGSVVNFGISGGGSYASGNVNIYVPQRIFLSPLPPTCGNNTIYQSHLPYIINWNLDPSNSQVAIVIEYDGFRSHRNNPLLADDTYLTTISTPDNGSYSITSSDLSSFPLGSVLNIYVSRSGLGLISTSGKTISVVAYAYTSRGFDYKP